MIERAFIAEYGNGKLGHEELLVSAELDRREIPWERYTLKKIHRRRLPLSRASLVVGDMDCLYGAMRQLEIPVPDADSYPAPLHQLLRRKVWTSTLGDEERRFRSGSPRPTFIKPRGRQKCFTGYVFESEYDFQRVYGVSKREPVYCSEVVDWGAEYRAYVVDGEVRAIDHYAGDPKVGIDRQIVEDAIRVLSESGRGFAGYGIDFGVLASGETAVVEMNDGFSLGAYEVGARDYMDLLMARWLELVADLPVE